MKRTALFLVVLSSLFFFISSFVLADECSPSCSGIEECQKKIDECTKLLEISAKATKPHEEQALGLEKNINAVNANIQSLAAQIEKKKAEIDRDREKITARQAVLDSHVREFYKRDYSSQITYLLAAVFTSADPGEILRNLGYRQSLIDRERQTITGIVLEVNDLHQSKKKLEESQSWLAAKRASLEVTLAPIRELVARAKTYQVQLSQTVGTLSARQQELIAAKIGSLNLSRSAGMTMACADDRKIDPGFGSGFAFYTFGIPHRIGMNQFGAFGRANAGQDYQDILRAYYNGVSFEKRGNITIKVEGHSDMPLEQYMLGIYEVPDSWPMAALKAQAVAARSYALAYTNNGANSICTTQSCQVYKGGNKGGNWEQAVKQTEGEVMTNGGQVIKAWYSSTDGGYTLSSGEYGWSATAWTKHTRDTSGDINNISDLFSKAYDRDSPCFYNAQGWRREYNKSAWLKPEEVADIVNVILLSANNNMIDTWDAQRVRNELGSRAFSRIDNVSMEFDLGSGRTTYVTLSGNAGTQRFDGTTFKNYFNLRAPANIAIVGPLFNIEKK